MELFVVAVGIAFLTALAAASRGRSSFGWFLLGLFFSLFALVAVLIMPTKKINPLAISLKTHIHCPDCKEFVLKEATICKHCGCKFVGYKEAPPKPTEDEDQPNVYIIN
jgi:hypothetical protein